MSDYSPLQFARDFEKFRSDLAAEPDPVDGLALMLDFWKNHSDSLPHQSNWTYLAEFIGELTGRCTKDNLENLSFDELTSIHAFLKTFSDRNMDNIKDAFDTVRREYARKLFYVGDYEAALKILGADTAIGSTDKDLIKGLNEFDTLYHIYALFKDIDSPIKNELLDILSEWQGYRESLYQDQALCLFVEKDHRGTVSRGRMKFLSGRVELFGKSMPGDEVTFDNQIKTPDDPFVGVAYDALEAVRGIFKRSDFRHKAARRYHAHFNIAGGNHQFTGDSIGLAAALLTYTQLMKPEIMRHERFLSSDVAFTGSIDKEGRVLPVNGDTIALKIERAFFSPVKYLVLPIDNLAIAQNALEQLSIKYPHRRLLLVGASHLSDLLENRNIIRSEKVCIGQLTARRVVKYSRMTKLQVLLLLVLIWALLAIIDTKTFAPWWFDWRIDHIEIMGNRFRTVNPDGKEIWVSEEFSEELAGDIIYLRGPDKTEIGIACDIDNDSRDELIIRLNRKGSRHDQSQIRYYDHDGTLINVARPYDTTTYPGDIAICNYEQYINYRGGWLYPVTKGDETFILTCAGSSYPYREQIMLYDNKGQKVSGPYLHTGGIWKGVRLSLIVTNICKAGLIGIGFTNNRYERASVVVLNPFDLSGVSPPFDNELFLASNMPRGSQEYYIAFPETILSQLGNARNFIGQINNEDANRIHIEVYEGVGVVDIDHSDSEDYSKKVPHITYVLDSNLIPYNAYLSDIDIDLFIKYCNDYNLDPPEINNAFYSELVEDVIVYYGDSIVHHPKSGIYFYKNK